MSQAKIGVLDDRDGTTMNLTLLQCLQLDFDINWIVVQHQSWAFRHDKFLSPCSRTKWDSQKRKATFFDGSCYGYDYLIKKVATRQTVDPKLAMLLSTFTLTWLKGIRMTILNWQRNMQVLPREIVLSRLCQWIPLLNLSKPMVSWMQQEI